MQVYQEVMQFEPPEYASRQLLRAGRITLVAQVPDILALPPPVPQDRSELLAALGQDEAIPSLHSMPGCFPEVHSASSWPYFPSVKGKEISCTRRETPGECGAIKFIQHHFSNANSWWQYSLMKTQRRIIHHHTLIC